MKKILKRISFLILLDILLSAVFYLGRLYEKHNVEMVVSKNSVTVYLEDVPIRNGIVINMKITVPPVTVQLSRVEPASALKASK